MTKEEIWIRWEQDLNCWNGRYPDTIGRYLDTKNSIRMPKEGIQIRWGGWYPNVERGIWIHLEAIWILEESIRIPATRKLRTTTKQQLKLKKNYFNLEITFGNQPRRH